TYYSSGLMHTYTDQNDTVTTDTYDDDGNLTEQKVADATGTVMSDTTYGYDADGRLLTTTVWPGTANQLVTETNVYDDAGNLTSSTDADGNKTPYTSDHAAQMATMTTPRGNVTGANPADYTWTYHYDADGNQTDVIDPASRDTITGYDADNRPVTVT